jgi:hypothetical protein
MSGQKPSYIEKGGKVLYRGENFTVVDFYFTCPCDAQTCIHPYNTDILMLILEGGKYIPFTIKDIKPAPNNE